ncbi:adhesion G protein-coupled receptor L4-like [Babylonia areolata]|uniref:adhesion G protein-coupled receptor L4-like n=1 Tax=Babylonia areolata TaxID=304850 RepID=UPI003FD5CF3D
MSCERRSSQQPVLQSTCGSHQLCAELRVLVSVLLSIFLERPMVDAEDVWCLRLEADSGGDSRSDAASSTVQALNGVPHVSDQITRNWLHARRSVRGPVLKRRHRLDRLSGPPSIASGLQPVTGTTCYSIMNASCAEALDPERCNWLFTDAGVVVSRYGSSHVCAYWDTIEHRWSEKGCHALKSNVSHTLCQCQHLSSFALIVNVARTVNNTNSFGQTVLTYYCLPISIIGLSLAVATFAFIRALWCGRSTVHVHMMSSLLASQILFVNGIRMTQVTALCEFIAICMHYTFLCTFSWMLVEGMFVYVMLVHATKYIAAPLSPFLHFTLITFAYGVPLMIVAVSLVFHFNDYNAGLYCWLSTENALIWSFMAPALIVIAINSLILSLAIYVMCKHSQKSKAMQNRSFYARLVVWGKGVVILLFLFGVTYLFGIFHLNQYSALFSYIFIHLNACQGGFIFVFLCLVNDKVKHEYVRLIRRFLTKFNVDLPFRLSSVTGKGPYWGPVTRSATAIAKEEVVDVGEGSPLLKTRGSGFGISQQFPSWIKEMMGTQCNTPQLL